MKKNVKNKKDGKSSSAILGATLVCFVLIAVYGIVSQLKVSYAFPKAFDKIDSTQIKQIVPTTKTELAYKPAEAGVTWKVMGDKFTGRATVNSTTYNLDMFCLEMFKNVPSASDNVTYSRTEENVEEAINYIITKAYENSKIEEKDNTVTISLSDGDYYDAQMAIWIYQNQALLAKDTITKADVIGADDEEKQSNVDQANDLKTMWNGIKTNHTNKHAKTIYDYVTGANNAKSDTSKNSIKINGKVELKLTKDNKYYETDLLGVEITKAVNTEFNGFKFNIKSDNKDVAAEIVDEKGNVITDYKELENKKFKIRLDASKLAVNTTTKLSGDVSGVFKHISFNKYKATNDWQIALLAVSTSKDESVPLKLSVTVPDTGFGYSGYIYIIGAIVLIVGLTIIYVNTKKQEN